MKQIVLLRKCYSKADLRSTEVLKRKAICRAVDPTLRLLEIFIPNDAFPSKLQQFTIKNKIKM